MWSGAWPAPPMPAVLALTVVLLAAVVVALVRSAPGRAGRVRFLVATAGPLLAWTLVVSAVGLRSGSAPTPVGLPVAALLLPLSLVAGAVWLRLTPAGRAVQSAPLHWLIGVHLLRAGYGAAFLLEWSQGRLPAEWAVPVGLGDIVIGLAAPVVARALAAGWRGGWPLTVTWSALGLADFAEAVLVANLSQPGPWQSLTLEPAVPLGLFPATLLPAIVVPLFVLLHLGVLMRLHQAHPAPLPAAPRA